MKKQLIFGRFSNFHYSPRNNQHLPIDQISARILNITLSIYRRDKVDSLYPEP